MWCLRSVTCGCGGFRLFIGARRTPFAGPLPRKFSRQVTSPVLVAVPYWSRQSEQSLLFFRDRAHTAGFQPVVRVCMEKGWGDTPTTLPSLPFHHAASTGSLRTPLVIGINETTTFVQSQLAPLGPEPAFGLNEKEGARKSEPQPGTPRPLTDNGHLSSLRGTSRPQAILAHPGNLLWGHPSIEPSWHTMGLLPHC